MEQVQSHDELQLEMLLRIYETLNHISKMMDTRLESEAQVDRIILKQLEITSKLLGLATDQYTMLQNILLELQNGQLSNQLSSIEHAIDVSNM